MSITVSSSDVVEGVKIALPTVALLFTLWKDRLHLGDLGQRFRAAVTKLRTLIKSDRDVLQTVVGAGILLALWGVLSYAMYKLIYYFTFTDMSMALPTTCTFDPGFHCEGSRSVRVEYFALGLIVLISVLLASRRDLARTDPSPFRRTKAFWSSFLQCSIAYAGIKWFLA